MRYSLFLQEKYSNAACFQIVTMKGEGETFFAWGKEVGVKFVRIVSFDLMVWIVLIVRVV